MKCIDHGQLLDEETVKMLGEKGIWLSLQALDEAPETAPASIREKKHLVVQGTFTPPARVTGAFTTSPRTRRATPTARPSSARRNRRNPRAG